MPKKKIKSHQSFNKKVDHESDEPVHVMFNTPLEFRKTLIGAQLDTAKMLGTYAELKSVRENKLILVQNFYTIYSNIRKLLTNLEKRLPDIKEDKTLVKEQVITSVKNIEKPKSEELISNSEIEKLKAELAGIEKRLGEL